MHLYLGAGSAVPTQLVLVPMLFLLPPAVVPACVALALVAADAVDRPQRILASLGDAWHAVGPALVFALFGAPEPELAAAGVLALAFAAQCASDLLIATARESLGRGIAPSVQLRVIGNVYLIDACLTPVGLLIAMACVGRPFALLLALPLLALLAVLAADRRVRMREAIGRLDELTAEHARLDRAIHRIGEAFASKLDRAALADIMVRTAVESLGADYGRAQLAAGMVEHGEQAPAVVAAAEDAARRSGELRVVTSGDEAAMAQPLTGGARAASTEVLTVMRRRRAVHARRAGAVRLPGPADRGGAGERHAARPAAAPGDGRRGHRPLQPPSLPGGARARDHPHAALGAADVARADRHRLVQDDQRHARPPQRRRRPAARGGHDAGRSAARPTSRPATAATSWP